MNLCIKAGLNTFPHIFPRRQVFVVVQSHTAVLVYVLGGGGGGGGRTKARICATSWTDSKWHPVKRDGVLIPHNANLIETS